MIIDLIPLSWLKWLLFFFFLIYFLLFSFGFAMFGDCLQVQNWSDLTTFSTSSVVVESLLKQTLQAHTCPNLQLLTLAKLPAHHLQVKPHKWHAWTNGSRWSSSLMAPRERMDSIIISNTLCWFHEKLSSRNVKLTEDQDLSLKVGH